MDISERIANHIWNLAKEGLPKVYQHALYLADQIDEYYKEAGYVKLTTRYAQGRLAESRND